MRGREGKMREGGGNKGREDEVKVREREIEIREGEEGRD